MIITCPCGDKKFEINEDLIPEKGRTLQCGSCNHKWFYIKEKNNESLISNEILSQTIGEDVPDVTATINKEAEKKIVINKNKGLTNEIDKIINKKDKALVKYQKKNIFKFGKILSYIIIVIISFTALILLLDTFMKPLENFFPNLEFLLFNLYETLKDIILFTKDLIK